MSELIIRELDKGLIQRANSNSMGGTRGDGSEYSYQQYAQRIISWPIGDETFFEDDNLTAYREGDRAYIKFVMRPQRQVIVALKSRGWWWNSGKSAWSTYLDKVDEEWVKGVSERYAKYL